jgi:hypothetical protein
MRKLNRSSVCAMPRGWVVDVCGILYRNYKCLLAVPLSLPHTSVMQHQRQCVRPQPKARRLLVVWRARNQEPELPGR